MEVEAKYTVPDRATFARLCQLVELAGYRLKSIGVKRVHDRYLDTEDRDILGAGYACRVRHLTRDPICGHAVDAAVRPGAPGTAVATLKGLGGADAGSGIHHRAEYETAVEKDDPTTWPESPARDLSLQLCGGQPLRELFSLHQERHLRLVYGDAEGAYAVAELSLDVVTPGESSSSPYYELELELSEQGSETELRLLAAELEGNWGLRPELRSKFERGLEFFDAVQGVGEERA